MACHLKGLNGPTKSFVALVPGRTLESDQLNVFQTENKTYVCIRAVTNNNNNIGSCNNSSSKTSHFETCSLETNVDFDVVVRQTFVKRTLRQLSCARRISLSLSLSLSECSPQRPMLKTFLGGDLFHQNYKIEKLLGLRLGLHKNAKQCATFQPKMCFKLSQNSF